MGTVTNTIELPGQTATSEASVKIRLNTSPAFQISTDDEIHSVAEPPINGGAWTAELVPNSDITPANTKYVVSERRKGEERSFTIIVPAGAGPFKCADILADPLDPPPTTDPSNEINAAEITQNVGPLAVNGFNLVPVPGLVVTVPPLDKPAWLMSKLWMEHSVANVCLGPFIAPVGSNTIGQQIDGALGFVAAIGKECTPVAWARLPAGFAGGNFQTFVYADVAGNISVIANTSSTGKLALLGV